MLVEFNAAMALETEGKELLPDVIGAGVRSLLGNPAAGFYLLAEAGQRGRLADDHQGMERLAERHLLVDPERLRATRVPPPGRVQGLYRHVQELAAKDPAVCGFRLYVERENERAQATYSALGMKQTRYLVFEELKPGVRFYR